MPANNNTTELVIWAPSDAVQSLASAVISSLTDHDPDGDWSVETKWHQGGDKSVIATVDGASTLEVLSQTEWPESHGLRVEWTDRNAGFSYDNLSSEITEVWSRSRVRPSHVP